MLSLIFRCNHIPCNAVVPEWQQCPHCTLECYIVEQRAHLTRPLPHLPLRKGNSLLTVNALQKVRSPQLLITKSVDEGSVLIGDGTKFRLSVSNVGDDRATDVTVRDVLPAGLQISTLPAGGAL